MIRKAPIVSESRSPGLLRRPQESGVGQIRRFGEAAGRGAIRLQEGVDLTTQSRVIGAFAREKRLALVFGELEGFVENRLDAFPTCVRHTWIDRLGRQKGL
jgi:hypothetical protein